jgi:X-X-X-Leu-X-X-Gly heptad repeat protein
MVLEYNARLEAIVARTLHQGSGQWAEGISQLESRLTQLDNIAAKCAHEIEPMHNSVRR